MASLPTPPPDSGLARQTSAAHVARYIRSLVVDGTLRRGDRVPQDEIAAALGVSRIPVREAIVALDREGWVTSEPHRGARVHGVDAQWVHDHYEILGALWALAARHAAERVDAGDLAELRDRLGAVRAAGDVDAFDAANHALLELVREMARSPRLTAALRAMTSIVPGNFFSQVPGTMEPQRRALGPIVDAIEARDGKVAARRMQELLAHVSTRVVEVLESRGALATDDEAPNMRQLSARGAAK
jgi:DNA-binding GntR family transcriptional regulator